MLVCCFCSALTKNTLSVGQRLNEGQSLTSSNGVYFVTMQGDGNLVVYRRGGAGGNEAIWWSRTAGACCGGFSLVMQGDNNLVMYSSRKASGGAVWSSRSICRSTPARAVMQNDGNFVIYAGDNSAIWASGTVGGRKSRHIGRGDRKC